jgi:hypothetical protein
LRHHHHARTHLHDCLAHGDHSHAVNGRGSTRPQRVDGAEHRCAKGLHAVSDSRCVCLGGGGADFNARGREGVRRPPGGTHHDIASSRRQSRRSRPSQLSLGRAKSERLITQSRRAKAHACLRPHGPLHQPLASQNQVLRRPPQRGLLWQRGDS